MVAQELLPGSVAKFFVLLSIMKKKAGTSPTSQTQSLQAIKDIQTGPGHTLETTGGLKLKDLVDATLDVDLVTLDEETVDKLFEEFQEEHGDKPSKSVTPTGEQVSADNSCS